MVVGKKKKALVIVNPKAGRIRVRAQVLDLTKLSICGIEPTMCATTARGDATNYVTDMAENYDIIICRGGDGTFNEVINGVMRLPRKKPIGYIPSGTTNDLAKTLGIPNNTRRALEIIIGGHSKPHDLGLFNGERYFSYISCFGAFTRASYSTPQSKKNAMGHAAYMLEAINCIKEIKPIHARVVIDGEELEGDYVYGAVSNSTSVAKVMKLDPKIVKLDDGKFEVMLVKNPKTFNGWKDTLIAAKTINYDRCESIIFKQGKKIEFFFDDEIAWTADGEYVNGGTHTVIENVNKAINIYR